MRNIVSASLLCGLLASGTGWAADQAEQDIRATILKSAEGWSTLNPDNNDALYTSSDKAVFFDVAPMEYTGWAAYKDGFKKAFAGFKTFKLALNDDLAVHHGRTLGWATVTWKADGQTKDDKAAHLEGRATLVLEKQGGKWKIVHEHYSVPAQL
jgi:ketosteroid isomerase-like protein